MNGTLKLPETEKSTSHVVSSSNVTETTSSTIQNYVQKQNETMRKSQEDLLAANQQQELANNQELQDQQGWLSWAWSYVPSVNNILPLNESTSSDNNNKPENSPKQIEIFIGFYIDEVVVNFKVSNTKVSLLAFKCSKIGQK